MEICCGAETGMQIREGNGCRSVSGNARQMGQGQPSPPSITAQNVLPCCLRRAERGRMSPPLRPPAVQVGPT